MIFQWKAAKIVPVPITKGFINSILDIILINWEGLVTIFESELWDALAIINNKLKV